MSRRQVAKVVRQLGQRSGEGLYLADGADNLEADGAGLDLGPLGFLVLLGVTPLRVDLLLPARHPSVAATLSAAGGLLLFFRRSDSDRRPPLVVEGESGFFLAYVPVLSCRMGRMPLPRPLPSDLLRSVVGYWAPFLLQATT